MSEKIRFEYGLRDEEAQIELDGKTIRVRKHISLEEKSRMAGEIVQSIMITSEDAGIILRSHLWRIAEIYHIFRYYTNIDTEDATPSDIFDWAVSSGIEEKIRDLIEPDYCYVFDMEEQLFENVKEEYAKTNNLEHAVMKTFGSILNGEDITETLAEATNVKEEMLEVAQQLKDAAKNGKQTPGAVKIGGNIIQIGKREI